MKKLLIFPLLVLLTGCVTYYTPEAVTDDGVYYAVDDQTYVDDLYGYDGYAVYPWRSLDYFYLGYSPYGHDYGFGYGYGYDYGGYGGFGYGGFSIGTSFGYSAWRYPYYSHYSPWYGPYRSHYYQHRYTGWRPYRGYCSHGHGCGYRGNRGHYRDRGHERFAAGDHNNRSHRGRNDENGNVNRERRSTGGDDQTSGQGAAPVSRYVSTAPSGRSGNRGMIIRSRETRKIGKSRVEPVQTKPRQSVDTQPRSKHPAASNNRSRRGVGEVRSRAGAKQGHSRTEPVESISPPQNTSNAVTTRVGRHTASRPVTSTNRSSRGAGEVRYRTGARQGRSRIESVRSVSPASGGKSVATPAARKAPRSVSRSPSRSESKASSGKSGRSQSGTKRSGSRRSQHKSVPRNKQAN